MRVLLVTGMFDEQRGKPSSKVAGYTTPTGYFTDRINGGSYDMLEHITAIASLPNMYDIVIWGPNVKSDLMGKQIEMLKAENPKMFLVSFKRNFDGEYSLPEVIAHGLRNHSNLIIMRTREYFEVLDPLGNSYGQRLDIPSTLLLALFTAQQIKHNTTRMRSVSLGKEVPHYDGDGAELLEFLEVVHEAGARFTEHVPVIGDNPRFLGNASFRCASGFPSFRLGEAMWISPRNVDKEGLSLEQFVCVPLNNSNPLEFYGVRKPSVDAPVQRELYKLLPDVRFMIHGHVYIDEAPFTETYVPCGSLEEISEIIGVAALNEGFGVVNLRNHGCIFFGTNPLQILNQLRRIKSRPLPEPV